MYIGKLMLLRIIVWPVWCLFLISVVFFIPETKTALEQSSAKLDGAEWFFMIAIVISIIAIVEASITILIRHFALIRPAMRNTFTIHSLGGAIRFFLVSFLNWFISETIVVYGLVLYIISERIEFLYIFGFFGLSLLLYHAPRLSPYLKSTD